MQREAGSAPGRGGPSARRQARRGAPTAIDSAPPTSPATPDSTIVWWSLRGRGRGGRWARPRSGGGCRAQARQSLPHALPPAGRAHAHQQRACGHQAVVGALCAKAAGRHRSRRASCSVQLRERQWVCAWQAAAGCGACRRGRSLTSTKARSQGARWLWCLRGAGHVGASTSRHSGLVAGCAWLPGAEASAALAASGRALPALRRRRLTCAGGRRGPAGRRAKSPGAPAARSSGAGAA